MDLTRRMTLEDVGRLCVKKAESLFCSTKKWSKAAELVFSADEIIKGQNRTIKNLSDENKELKETLAGQKQMIKNDLLHICEILGITVPQEE